MKVNDIVIGKGICYPHWKDHIFIVDAIFDNNDIGLRNILIRVSSEDFEVSEDDVFIKVFNIISEYNTNNEVLSLDCNIKKVLKLDHLDIVEIIIKLEREFSINIPDVDIHSKRFNYTIRSIVNYIRDFIN